MNYTEKNKLVDKICASALMIIFIEVFFAITHEGFGSFAYVLKMQTILNVIGAIFLLIGVGLLIYAYMKDKGWKAIYGIEFLVLAFMSLILPYSYVQFKYPFNKLHIAFPIAFLVYYIIKILVIIIKANKSKKN